MSAIKEAFKNILLERQLESLPTGVKREKEFRIVENKVLAVIGVRRGGKSVYLKQIADSLRKQDPNCNLVYVNFFDERLIDCHASQLGLLIDAYNETFPEAQKAALTHIFLDEIQVIKGWELFVDRLRRSGNYQVYISGSSASMLSREIATAMRGRAISLEIFPFSFREVLTSCNLLDLHAPPKIRGAIVRKFNEYLFCGGFPEAFNKENPLRRTILQEYFQVMLYKDIIERHNPSDPRSTAQAFRILLNQSAGLYTLNKLHKKLRSLSLKVTKSEVGECIEWIQDTYALFSVPLFTESAAKQLVNPRKVYCVDNGLMEAMNQGVLEDRGQLLENLVFTHLRRVHEKIFYYRDAKQHEVDFVVEGSSGKLQLVQVTLSQKDEKVKDRETKALRVAMSELGVRQGLIITIDEVDEVSVPEGKIVVLPAWKYLMEMN